MRSLGAFPTDELPSTTALGLRGVLGDTNSVFTKCQRADPPFSAFMSFLGSKQSFHAQVLIHAISCAQYMQLS